MELEEGLSASCFHRTRYHRKLLKQFVTRFLNSILGDSLKLFSFFLFFLVTGTLGCRRSLFTQRKLPSSPCNYSQKPWDPQSRLILTLLIIQSFGVVMVYNMGTTPRNFQSFDFFSTTTKPYYGIPFHCPVFLRNEIWYPQKNGWLLYRHRTNQQNEKRNYWIGKNIFKP